LIVCMGQGSLERSYSMSVLECLCQPGQFGTSPPAAALSNVSITGGILERQHGPRQSRMSEGPGQSRMSEGPGRSRMSPLAGAVLDVCIGRGTLARPQKPLTLERLRPEQTRMPPSAGRSRVSASVGRSPRFPSAGKLEEASDRVVGLVNHHGIDCASSCIIAWERSGEPGPSGRGCGHQSCRRQVVGGCIVDTDSAIGRGERGWQQVGADVVRASIRTASD
jgi:hypothetical protein